MLYIVTVVTRQRDVEIFLVRNCTSSEEAIDVVRATLSENTEVCVIDAEPVMWGNSGNKVVTDRYSDMAYVTWIPD